jgi:signal peptidase II
MRYGGQAGIGGQIVDQDRHRTLLRIVLLFVALATVGCDRVTKHIATTALAGNPAHSYWSGAIWIGYTENTGGFLSLGAALPELARSAVFTWGTGLVLLAIVVVLIRGRVHGWAAVGLTLFVAGGLSNWIDRAMNGRVVDFLNVGIGSVRTGVFNVADMAILAGALAVAVGEIGLSSRRGRL